MINNYNLYLIFLECFLLNNLFNERDSAKIYKFLRIYDNNI